MKALFSFKPIDYLKIPHMFAGFAEIDLETGDIGRVIRIPAASFRTSRAFMTNFIQGLCVDENYIYASAWNFVVVIDRDDFTILDAFSTKEMADLHALDVDEENIYVISTATECLICLDKKSFEKKWIWGPNHEILNYGAFPFLPSWRNGQYRKLYRKYGWRKYVYTPKYRGQETRHVNKNNSSHYRHHLNDVNIIGDDLYLNTKGWFNSVDSAIIKIDKEGKNARFFVKPKTFIGSHDGILHKDRYYVTEADNNSVASVDSDGKDLKRFKLEPDGYFVRGLILEDDKNYVGFTPLRGTQDKAMIIEYDKEFSKPLQKIVIPDVCGENEQVAVHKMLKI
jgi:hypothetical protein